VLLVISQIGTCPEHTLIAAQFCDWQYAETGKLGQKRAGSSEAMLKKSSLDERRVLLQWLDFPA